VAASAEEEVLLFEILRLQPILNTRRYLLQLQPFLEILPLGELDKRINHIWVRRVSTLLEILLAVADTCARAECLAAFQPFLRFYGVVHLIACDAAVYVVSTLLEILHQQE